MLNVQAVEYRGAHRLWLRFNDGTEGEVDLAAHLVGPVFLPLRDPALFAAVRLDPGLPNAWESTDVVDLQYQPVRPELADPRRPDEATGISPASGMLNSASRACEEQRSQVDFRR